MLVNYTLKNVLHIGTRRLIPGQNSVDSKEWPGMLKLYPKVKRLVEDGKIQVLGKDGRPLDEEKAAGGDTKDTLSADDLAKIPAKRAVAIVNETVDTELLGNWALSEDRKEVIKAIEGQLDKIAKYGDDKSDKAAKPEGGGEE